MDGEPRTPQTIVLDDALTELKTLQQPMEDVLQHAGLTIKVRMERSRRVDGRCPF